MCVHLVYWGCNEATQPWDVLSESTWLRPFTFNGCDGSIRARSCCFVSSLHSAHLSSCSFREMCDESMTHSASSASSLDSHAPSESSQSQGVRWEEQQKVLALEQLCGVFRVDLGHMRSLRLFFRSDVPPVPGTALATVHWCTENWIDF